MPIATPAIIRLQAWPGGARLRGTRTRIIAGRFLAGESVEELAQDYCLLEPEVEMALRYELARAKRLKMARGMLGRKEGE